MSRAKVVLAALLIAAVLSPVTRADAAYSVLCTGYSSCQSKGYSDSGYAAKQRTSYWAMYTGTNCTNYVAYRLVSTNGMPNKRPKPGVGNARDWGTTMASITNTTPTVGSVAWWGSKVGGSHVAYVEKVVSPTEIWVSESNWSGAFDWRKITKTGAGWPQGFIHFADPAAPATEPLVVDESPTLSSVPTVDVELTASTGSWTPAGSGTTYAYQWQLDGAAVPGATASTFTPTAAMLGRDLGVKVTASRSGFRPASLQVEPAQVWPQTLTMQSAPSISGTARVGTELQVQDGSWFPQPDEYAYRWLVGSTPISGATGPTFVPSQAQAGQALRVEITARHPDYGPQVVTTAATSAVAPRQ